MNGFGPTFSGQQDYLERYSTIDRDRIRAVRNCRLPKLKDQRYQTMLEVLANLPVVTPSVTGYSSSVVKIGQANDLNAEQRQIFSAAVDTFIPWKKGPFDLFGLEIDAEWRSDLKWDRILPKLGSIKGHRVADIGCNNGYFMYRMLNDQPELVIGLEPECRHALNFALLQHYAQAAALYFEPLGIEHMDLYPDFFDTVFCLGILYHHTDPIGLLKKIFTSMAKGGQLIIECQGIPGSEPVALMPEGRYANARGFWWLPTRSCLEHWVKRSGFIKIDCFADVELTSDEQRRSTYAPIESLEDFLDKDDPKKTIEGYPAPRRFYLRAIRP